MSLSTAVNYARLSIAIVRANIQSAMEYRISFLTQVVGMIVNDVALVCLWYLFFRRFPSVSGWTFRDNMELLALSTTCYGLLMTFMRGAFEISRYINRGDLDYFMALPRDVLWQITVSKTDISALGDLIFGVATFFVFVDVDPLHYLYFLSVCLLASLILYSFVVLTQSMTFFFGNLEDAADHAFWATFSFSFYPQDSFHGWLKVVMLTVLPGFFVSTLPMKLLQAYRQTILLLLVSFCVLLFVLAVRMFNRGIARYESGNGINVRI